MSLPESVLGLLLVVVLGTIAAHRLRVAYPVVLVVLGLIVSFVPGLPNVALPPNLVFLIFLPPLLYDEGLTAPFRQYVKNAGAIARLSIGLVVVTIGVVAAVYHALRPEIGWGVAIILGALVSPTDETAVVLIGRSFSLPRRLEAIIEGESLFNDVVSLVIFNTAVAAAVAAATSARTIVVELLLASLGGIAVGFAVAFVARMIRSQTSDPPVTNLLSLMTAYAAYIVADAVHASGVLAVVTCALYLSRIAPRAVSAQTRIQNRELFAVLTYVINGVLFLLVGLQLRTIALEPNTVPLRESMVVGIAIAAVVLIVRTAWMFAAAAIRGKPHGAREAVLLSWSGLRGGVSLAAALAIPLTLGAQPFPHRGEIIIITYTVILATLVLQGLTFGPIIKRLGLPEDDEEGEVDRLRDAVARAAGVPMTAPDDADTPHGRHTAPQDDRPKRKALVAAERRELLRLFDAGGIDDDVMRRIERELDIEEIALDG